MPTHLSGNKITYVVVLSSSLVSKSINCISNPVSMVSFNSSSSRNESVGASVVKSGRADKSSSRVWNK